MVTSMKLFDERHWTCWIKLGGRREVYSGWIVGTSKLFDERHSEVLDTKVGAVKFTEGYEMWGPK